MTLIVGVGIDASHHVPSWLTSGATGVQQGVAPVTVQNTNGAWSYSLVQDSYGYNVLDLSQFVGNSSSPFYPCPDVTQPCSDLQLLIRETMLNTANFNCSVQAVPLFTAQYTNADQKGAGLMGPYLPRVDYQSLAWHVLPLPPVSKSDLPDPAYCGVLPAAPTLNAPTAGNPVAWPTYWPGNPAWPLPLNCGTGSAPQAAPFFVASLVASEDWSNNDTLCGSTGACNFVNYLTPQNDAFPDATAPPVPITIVGTGFGYLSTTAPANPPVGVNPQQILPFAGQASSLVSPNTSSPLLEIRDYPGPNGVAWDTATSTQCQVYIANWADSSISLDVNLPTQTWDYYNPAVFLSPFSDMSPLTFFPNVQNTTTQKCPVANGDTLKITVANAQGGGSMGAFCVLVGTPGPQNCPPQ